MSPAALLAASVIQISVFLGPLVAARAGMIDGQLAALTAVAIWFVAGLPLSFAIVDAARPPGSGIRDQPAANRRPPAAIPPYVRVSFNPSCETTNPSR